MEAEARLSLPPSLPRDQDTDTNPLAGCLPAFGQIPVFIALYKSVLNLALQDEIDQPFFWVPSIEGPTFAEGRGLGWLLGNPALGLSWHDGAPPLGWETTALYCVLPVALVITQAISLSLSTPPPTGEEDDSTKRIQLILKFLPLLIGFFAANVRARRRPRDARARSGTGKPPPPSLRARPPNPPPYRRVGAKAPARGCV